ncbi:MAG: hypothetical protein QJR14_08240, partial [Bacillota bacterium]|nr:hypothetical protein [Bacillota bacterium]
YRNGGRWLLLMEERSGRGVHLVGAHPAALGGVEGALAVSRPGVRSFAWGGRFVVNWQGLTDAEAGQVVGSLR